MANSKILFLGTFDAEAYWRDPELARLPALPDPATDAIVAAMDELLFPCCRACDLLLTRFPMNPGFKAYLERLEFRFDHNQTPLETQKAHSAQTVFGLLCNPPQSRWRELLAGVAGIEPYAVLPDTEEFCHKFAIPCAGPAPDAVIKVNSKVYSHTLARDLGFKNYGIIVNSSRELEKEGLNYLKNSPFLVKDPFGVSGKGNLLIQNGNVWRRIIIHLAAQENKGRRVVMLLEPFLKKELDFSCQMRIAPDGRVRILSLQKMINQQLAYQGSTRLEPERVAALERLGYFQQMESVAAQIYRDGYFGDVGVDSMWLHDGTLALVVEINARKSMGLINHHLDQFLGRYGSQGSLSFLTLGYPGLFHFEQFLAKMEEEQLLFSPGRPRGILPLSANTLTANLNREDTAAPFRIGKGRFYFAIAAPLPGNTFLENTFPENALWLEKLRGFCAGFGFRIY
jgi:hypothetical protein